MKATPDDGYRLLSELSIAILGLGDIGRVVGKSCKHFGMTVYAMVSQMPTVKQPYVDEYFTLAEMTEYLERADYVCNILPITKTTNDILSGNVLKHCAKKRSVLMNIGRGNVLSEESIVEALNNGWIRGAVLDVFRLEPLPSDSMLWTSPNVIITPHISALTMDRHVSILIFIYCTCTTHVICLDLTKRIYCKMAKMFLL